MGTERIDKFPSWNGVFLVGLAPFARDLLGSADHSRSKLDRNERRRGGEGATESPGWRRGFCVTDEPEEPAATGTAETDTQPINKRFVRYLATRGDVSVRYQPLLDVMAGLASPAVG